MPRPPKQPARSNRTTKIALGLKNRRPERPCQIRFSSGEQARPARIARLILHNTLYGPWPTSRKAMPRVQIKYTSAGSTRAKGAICALARSAMRTRTISGSDGPCNRAFSINEGILVCGAFFCSVDTRLLRSNYLITAGRLSAMMSSRVFCAFFRFSRSRASSISHSSLNI